ncbi:MAG TPA: hypothetical protein VGE51_14820 [Fontimonas sp.]
MRDNQQPVGSAARISEGERNTASRATARTPAYYGRDALRPESPESHRHRKAFDALMSALGAGS